MSSPGKDALWEWFGLSYASWLTLPRILMHEMPDEWQGRMAGLLREAEERFPGADIGPTRIGLVGEDGRFHKVPAWLSDYRRPHLYKDEIARVRGDASTKRAAESEGAA